MKNLKYILIATIFMFVGINGVSADDSGNTEVGQKFLNEALDTLTSIEDNIIDPVSAVENCRDQNDLSACYSYKDDLKSTTEEYWTEYVELVMDAEIDELSDSAQAFLEKRNAIETRYYANFSLQLDTVDTNLKYPTYNRTCVYRSDDNGTEVSLKITKSWDGLYYVVKAKIDRVQNQRIHFEAFSSVTDITNDLIALNINIAEDGCLEYGIAWKAKSRFFSPSLPFEQGKVGFIPSSSMDIIGTIANEGKDYFKAYGIVKLVSDSENDSDSSNSTVPSEPTDSEQKYECDIFGDTLIELIGEIYGYFNWIIPLLIIILSMLDFVKVVGTGKDDDFKKAQNNLIKRVILGIVFFLIPTIIRLIINFSGITELFSNGDSILEAITCILK